MSGAGAVVCFLMLSAVSGAQEHIPWSSLNEATCFLKKQSAANVALLTTHHNALCWYIPQTPNILAHQPFHSKHPRFLLLPWNSSGELHPHTTSMFPQQPMNSIMSRLGREENYSKGGKYIHWSMGEICEILSQSQLLNTCVWMINIQIKIPTAVSVCEVNTHIWRFICSSGWEKTKV